MKEDPTAERHGETPVTLKKKWQTPDVLCIANSEINSGDTQGTKEHYDDGLGHLYYS